MYFIINLSWLYENSLNELAVMEIKEFKFQLLESALVVSIKVIKVKTEVIPIVPGDLLEIIL
jgi:hypothetical protein